MSRYTGWLSVAFRSLRKAPGFTVSAVGILAAGLALCSYMFAAVNAYVLRPLPFDDSESLVHLELADLENDSLEVPALDFLEWRRALQNVEHLGGYYQGTVNLSGGERPERFEGAFLTSEVLPALGVQPLHGRVFQAADEAPGAPAVVLLGYATWRDRYRGDPAAVGRTVRVNGHAAVVIGVMPEGFRFPAREEVWVPLVLDPAKLGSADDPSLELIARLAPGVAMVEAQDEATAVLQRVDQSKPAAALERRAVVKPLAHEYVGKEARAIIFTMLGAVLLVLLIACANVANLILARSAARSRELAIRSALGASRRRLAVQLAVETLLLSVVAGGLAFALARQGTRWTQAAMIANGGDMLPAYWVRFTVDWRDVVFLAVASTLVTLLAGLLPALRALSGDLTAPIKSGGGSGRRKGHLSRGLVAGEIALCTVLLAGTGLMVRSVIELGNADVGGATANVLSGRIALFPENYPEPDQRVRLLETLAERAAAIPGVTRATVATALPGTFSGGGYYSAEGAAAPEPGREPHAGWVAAAPSYLAMFEIPLLQGRGFTTGDRRDAAQVAMVNRSFAAKVWPEGDPVGKRLRLGRGENAEDWRTVVGVIPDLVHGQLDDGLRPTIYVPLAQADVRFASVAVRGDVRAESLAEPLRSAVTALDADLPVYFLRTLDEWVAIGRFEDDFLALLFAIFGAVGVLLAAAGLYAVIAYSVSQKTREIGVRRALGAPDAGILRWVLRQGFVQAALGIGIGLPVALGFGRLIADELYKVSPFDPLTFAGVILLVTLVAVAATMVPARRALGVAPNTALRYD